MITDPFELLGERTISSPIKARMRAAATRAERAKQKRLVERDLLFKEWQRWHAKRCAELLAGPYNKQAKTLISFLEQMTDENDSELVEQAGAWVNTDRDTKHVILSLIDARCIYLREQSGRPPFDDNLNDPPTTVFLKIRGW